MSIDTRGHHAYVQSAAVDDERTAFRTRLVEAGLLVLSSVDGLYLRSDDFEQVARGIERFVHDARPPGYAPLLYFPPLMPRTEFLKTDYLRSFPDLTGSVDTFTGDDADHAALLRLVDTGADWTTGLSPAEVVLCSAACHPLYAALPKILPGSGVRYEVQGYCFRHEPSLDPCRMQSFRQHEFVFVGPPGGALAHRDEWLDHGLELLAALGLPVSKVVANDPFFGRAGRMLAANQKHETLKYEIVCPVSSEETPTAISSANYHLDHFGLPFDIRLDDGSPSHSACIGFGLERITLGLLRTHGLDPAAWPARVRSRLWP